MKRKITIEVETERIVVFRPSKELELWCPDCKLTVQVASLCGVTHFIFLEAADSNFIDKVNGPLLICLNSLLKHVKKRGGIRARRKETQ